MEHNEINDKSKSHQKIDGAKMVIIMLLTLFLCAFSFTSQNEQKNIQSTAVGSLAKKALGLIKANKYNEIDDISGPDIKYNPFARNLFKSVTNSLQGVNIEEMEVRGGEYKEYSLKGIFAPRRWHIYFSSSENTYKVEVKQKESKLIITRISLMDK